MIEQDRPLIRFGLWLARQMTRYYHQLQVLSPCQLPREGPAILVSNHTSGLDPLLLQSACPRLVTWFMTQDFYHMPGVNWVCRTIGAIPVDRAAPGLGSLRDSMRALAAGRVLGIFPEGRIEPTREFLPFQTGVALLAIRSGAPVYPAYIDGTQRNQEVGESYMRPNMATVRFGPQVVLDRGSNGREGLEAATERIKAAVAALKEAC